MGKSRWAGGRAARPSPFISGDSGTAVAIVGIAAIGSMPACRIRCRPDDCRQVSWHLMHMLRRRCSLDRRVVAALRADVRTQQNPKTHAHHSVRERESRLRSVASAQSVNSLRSVQSL